MKHILTFTVFVILVLSIPGVWASSLVLQSTISLAPNLELTSSNYHPQGLGYDPVANELLYVQQSAKMIHRTDMIGNYLGSVSINYSYVNGIASDGTYYYFTDYAGNASSPDLFRVLKNGTGVTQISTEIAAYGAYPIDVREGKLYRTNVSTSYSYSMLNQIRVSSASTPDTVERTMNISTSYGIADFTVDVANDSIWLLEYTGSSSIKRYSLSTGTLLETFSLGLDGLDAGLTNANGKLYYYDWVYGNSTLKIYDIQGLSSVPEPATWLLFTSVLGILAFARKR